MNSLQNKINEILQQADIEGLVGIGAPKDEYAQESILINAAIEDMESIERTVENIESAISVIWASAFELSPPEMQVRRESIRRVAENIYSLMLQE